MLVSSDSLPEVRATTWQEGKNDEVSFNSGWYMLVTPEELDLEGFRGAGMGGGRWTRIREGERVDDELSSEDAVLCAWRIISLTPTSKRRDLTQRPAFGTSIAEECCSEAAAFRRRFELPSEAGEDASDVSVVASASSSAGGAPLRPPMP